MDQEFKDWMFRVDGCIIAFVGLTADDLADQPYHDWWTDGATPEQAAEQALANEGFFF